MSQNILNHYNDLAYDAKTEKIHFQCCKGNNQTLNIQIVNSYSYEAVLIIGYTYSNEGSAINIFIGIASITYKKVASYKSIYGNAPESIYYNSDKLQYEIYKSGYSCMFGIVMHPIYTL